MSFFIPTPPAAQVKLGYRPARDSAVLNRYSFDPIISGFMTKKKKKIGVRPIGGWPEPVK